jgi:hypothetical protein
VHDRDQDGPRRDGGRYAGRVDEPVRIDGNDGEPESLARELLAGGEDGFVLDRGGDDVVSGVAERGGDPR